MNEAHLQSCFDHETDGREFITSRSGALLYHGLKIAERPCDFLAYSQSALGEHAVWQVCLERRHVQNLTVCSFVPPPICSAFVPGLHSNRGRH
jgi:hypothetical protein